MVSNILIAKDTMSFKHPLLMANRVNMKESNTSSSFS